MPANSARRRVRATAVAVMIGCCATGAFAQRRPPTGAVTQMPAPAGGRAGGQAPSPQGPVVVLNVDRSDVRIAELITLSLSPAETVTTTPYVLIVDFGDGTKETMPPGNTQLQHRYRAAGTYSVSLSVLSKEKYTSEPVPQNRPMVTVHPITLAATPGVAAVGESVSFVPSFEAFDPLIRVRLTFDVDTTTDWTADAQTVHAYAKAGAYMPSAEVGILDDGEVVSITSTEPTPVRVEDVGLEAPTSESLNQAVTFTVRFPEDPAVRYRVNFGDGSPPSDWSSSPTATYTYLTAGTYQPFGEVGRASATGVTQVASSAPVALVIVQTQLSAIPNDPLPPPPPPVWWLYVIAGLAAVVVGYGAKQALASPPPTVTVHPGGGDAGVETPGGDLDLRLEVRLHRNDDEAQETLSTGGEPLIRKSWRRHE